MNRGIRRAVEKIRDKSCDTFADLFKEVAMTVMSAVGGSAGPLYGTFFMKLGQKLGAQREVNVLEFAEAMQEGLAGVMSLGKSHPGDKTMIDARALIDSPDHEVVGVLTRPDARRGRGRALSPSPVAALVADRKSVV